jgi:hypothetical protein
MRRTLNIRFRCLMAMSQPLALHLALLLFLTGGSFLLSAQQKPDPDRPADNLAEYQARYAERIKQTHLAGVYIPANLSEAIKELEKRTPAESLDAYRKAPEEVVVRKLFFGLGRWIIHNWGFYEGSRLSHSLREQGIAHPEDMARVIMTSYHRYLNGRPTDLESQVEAIRTRIREEEEERRKRAKVLHEERRPAEPPGGQR